jgi:hypothetical protein
MRVLQIITLCVVPLIANVTASRRSAASRVPREAAVRPK